MTTAFWGGIIAIGLVAAWTVFKKRSTSGPRGGGGSGSGTGNGKDEENTKSNKGGNAEK